MRDETAPHEFELPSRRPDEPTMSEMLDLRERMERTKQALVEHGLYDALKELIGEIVTVKLKRWYQPASATALLVNLDSSGRVVFEGADRYRLEVNVADIDDVEIELDETLRARFMNWRGFPQYGW